VGPAYFQPGQLPPVFSNTPSTSQPIPSSNMEVSKSIQNQGVGRTSKEPVVIVPIVQTYSTQSKIPGQTFSL
jgi:hypothetical protein